MTESQRRSMADAIKVGYEKQKGHNLKRDTERVSDISTIVRNRQLDDPGKMSKIEGVLNRETVGMLLLKSAVGMLVLAVGVYLVVQEFGPGGKPSGATYAYITTCTVAVGLGLLGTGITGTMSILGPNLRATGMLGFTVLIILAAPDGNPHLIAAPDQPVSRAAPDSLQPVLQLFATATAHAQDAAPPAGPSLTIDATVRVYVPAGNPGAKRAANRIRESLKARDLSVYSRGSMFRALYNRVTAKSRSRYRIVIEHRRVVTDEDLESLQRHLQSMFPEAEVVAEPSDSIVSEVAIHLRALKPLK